MSLSTNANPTSSIAKAPWQLVHLGALLLVLALSGCSTVYPPTRAGTGTYSHLSGTLEWTYPVTLQEAWTATHQALQALQVGVLTQTLDGLGGAIEARRTDASLVYVNLLPVNDRVTQVRVQVKGPGRRLQAEHLQQAIREQLRL